jgi:hypothetical protein
LIAVSAKQFAYFAYTTEAPPQQSLTVRNAARDSGPMSYTITGAPSWLIVTPPEGDSASPLEINSHMLGVDPDAVGAGEYLAQLEVENPEAANSPLSITVFLALTDPNDADSDGLSNAEEEALGTDPARPDTDGDGYADGLEVELGTDPADRNSIFRIVSATSAPDGSSVSITWTSAPGRSYFLEASAEMRSETWQVLLEVPASEEGNFTTAEDHPPADAVQLHYRVRLKD